MDLQACVKEANELLAKLYEIKDDITASKIILLIILHQNNINATIKNSTPLSPSIKNEAFDNYIEAKGIAVSYLNDKSQESERFM